MQLVDWLLLLVEQAVDRVLLGLLRQQGVLLLVELLLGGIRLLLLLGFQRWRVLQDVIRIRRADDGVIVAGGAGAA